MNTADADRAFEAPDLIEVMDEAVRYNGFLITSLIHWAGPARRLLDFGAGNGRFCAALHERAFAMHAVEPDHDLREGIRARGVEARDSIEAFAVDPPFDGIYTINVLEHIEADEAVLRAFFDRLAPGGRLLIYVPAFEVLYSSNDARVGHLRRYRREGLIRIVRNAGFQLERARYVDSLGFFAALVYRVFGDRDGDLSVRAVRLYDSLLFPISRLLDRFVGRWFGKNLLLTAFRPG